MVKYQKYIFHKKVSAVGIQLIRCGGIYRERLVRYPARILDIYTVIRRENGTAGYSAAS